MSTRLSDKIEQHGRKLWSLLANSDNGFVNGFTITAYQIAQQVVLVQEFTDGEQVIYNQAFIEHA